MQAILMLLLNHLDHGRAATQREADAGEPDDVLVALAQADPRAFGPLYERYHDRIYRYCYTRLGSRDAAEDVAAEAFLKALGNLHRYRQGSNFPAWLYTIARHAVADHYERHRPTASWDEGLERRASDDVVAGTGKHLDRAALAHAIASLPEEQRMVMELQLAGWSGAETAAALGKTLAAVKMVRYRALGRLQQMLTQEPGQ
jgi:RNA polymerase sigma-70 factor (ECF subfamily)